MPLRKSNNDITHMALRKNNNASITENQWHYNMLLWKSNNGITHMPLSKSNNEITHMEL